MIQAALKLGDNGGLAATGLLHTWTQADDKSGRDVAKAIAFYQKWYREKFPSAPPPELPKADSAKSKYTFQQIADLSEHDGRGSAERGRLIFTKAKCVKCHRFQSEGEGVGPDLTSVRRRFQRKEIVESIVYPSQVISDQYRMVQVETKEGQVYVGHADPRRLQEGQARAALVRHDEAGDPQEPHRRADGVEDFGDAHGAVGPAFAPGSGRPAWRSSRRASSMRR